MVEVSLPIWVGFFLLVAFALVADLGLFQGAKSLDPKQAGLRTAMWVGFALSFAVGLFFWQGGEVALLFITGYLIEYSLSIDNIFVFLLIFSYFSVPKEYHQRVLFWGILGAISMRAVMIFAGVALIEHFHWLIYLFGAFLIFTSYKMAVGGGMGPDPAQNPVVRWARTLLPVTETFEGNRFFVVHNGKRFMTPLFVVLLVVESSDLMFAVDSIPAILAITHDPFLILTSNVFAISGLRSLYFLVTGIVDRFRYLKPAVAIILGFVGIKMVMSDVYPIPAAISLGFIVLVLTGAGLLSALVPQQSGEPKRP